MINAEAWAALPDDLKEIVETTCQAITTDMMSEYTYGNANSLYELSKNPNVEVRPFPDDVLRLLRDITLEIVAELSATDPMWKKIATSYYDFLGRVKESQRVTEQAYLNTRKL